MSVFAMLLFQIYNCDQHRVCDSFVMPFLSWQRAIWEFRWLAFALQAHFRHRGFSNSGGCVYAKPHPTPSNKAVNSRPLTHLRTLPLEQSVAGLANQTIAAEENGQAAPERTQPDVCKTETRCQTQSPAFCEADGCQDLTHNETRAHSCRTGRSTLGLRWLWYICDDVSNAAAILGSIVILHLLLTIALWCLQIA